MIAGLRERISRQPWWIAAAVLVLLALWVGSGALSPRKRGPAAALPATAARPGPIVQVERMAAQPVSRTVVVSGRTAPARLVEIKAETTGRVTAVGAPRGARVPAGGLIVRLDDADRSARLSEARAKVRQREVEYEGQLQLKPAGYISEAKLAESAAQLESARAELRRAELDLARMQIRAPFAGALQERMVEVGDYVSPGTRIATFVDERRLIVAGALAENQAANVRPGLKGTARLATGEEVDGVVRYVAPVADAGTRTFTVELEFPNPAGKLPVGVTAQIALPVGTVLAHKVSPALLTLDDGGVVGIKILEADGRVAFVPAEIARTSADGVWITGLPETVAIITAGQGFVRAGQSVRTDEAYEQAEALAARSEAKE